MDRLEALGNSLSQMTMYDIKSMYNQAKNMVLNVSEMEAKVQEATNDEPWGASSTLMSEIAQGTFSFQHFNEIMPAIYSRFMDKEARQWRQIYKALQLLEYLVKHGSERVVDDARSHVSTLKMLRSFHYIDDKGKDEGINVRNRAKELVELLSDVDKIRTERRKAKANKHKYTGTGNDGGYGGGYGGGLSFSSGGSRYGGFGSDSLGGSGGGYEREYGSYGGGSGGGSSSHAGGFRDTSARAGFEEYDAGGDEIDVPRRSNSISTSRASPATNPSRSSAAKAKATPTAPPPAPAPEVDLLGGFDDPIPASTVNKLAAPQPTAVSLDDDDFADFQAAPTTPVPTSAGAPTNVHARGASKPNLMDMLQSNPAPAQQRSNVTAAQQAIFGNAMRSPASQPQQSQQQQNLFGGMTSSTPMMSPTALGSFQQQQQPQRANTMSPTMMTPNVMSPTTMTPSAANVKPAPAPAKSGGGFDDLWSMSLGSASKPAAPTQNKSIKDLEREKAQSGLWGAGGNKPAGAGAQSPFGAFGSAAPPSSSSGGDDLLL